MWTTINTLLAIRISSAANRFIYYVQKLPLLGGRVKDDWYARRSVKRAAAVIALILTILWGFLSRAAYVGLLLYGPIAIGGGELSPEGQLAWFVHIFILLSFLAAGVSSATVLEPKREKYIAVKLMRLSPARYMQAALGYRYVLFGIYLLPALLYFGSLVGVSPLQAAGLAAAVVFWRVLCEYLHLKLFEKTGHILIKNAPVVWLFIAVCFACAYAPLLVAEFPVGWSVALGWLAFLPVAAAGLLAAVGLARYPRYVQAVDAATKRDDPLLDLGRLMREAQQKDVQTKDGDYAGASADPGRFQGKEGYAYLNAVFFARHRSIVIRPVYKRLAIVAVLGAAAVVLAWRMEEASAFIQTALATKLPMLTFILFFLSAGERVCRAFFYNCDLSLLRYRFYRDAAGRHYRIRLGRIALLNLGIAAALCLALTVAGLAADAARGDLVMLWMIGLSLSVFFSVHHLFLYYIFQPYATESNTKNPFYHVLNLGVSSASGASLFIPIPSAAFAVAAVLLTLLYMGLALLLVSRYGPRTFRVK